MRKPNLLKGFVKLQMVDSILNVLRRQIIRSRPVGVVQCASLDEGVSKIKKKRGDFFLNQKSKLGKRLEKKNTEKLSLII